MRVIYSKKEKPVECILVNYANSKFKYSQKISSRSGVKVGGFKKVVCYSPSDIDKQFYRKNKRILMQKRGNGYWLWKPYFMSKALANLNEGEYLFYCDAGAHFVNSVSLLIQSLEAANQDIMPFELSDNESMWTKRDTFVLMDCDTPRFTGTNQRYGSFMLIRKSSLSLQLISEWLTLAQDPRIMTDMKNTCGLPNYERFVEHRHDQSIFSLLTKKYGMQVFKAPITSYGRHAPIGKYINSDYPPIIDHTRRVYLTTWITRRKKQWVKRWIKKIIRYPENKEQ